MPMGQCVIGNGGERTRLAIEKYRALCAATSLDDYFQVVNENWKKRMRLGCPKCGAAKRFGIGLCRRCYRLQAALKRVSITSPRPLVLGFQHGLAAFAKTLGKRRDITPEERLSALLKWKPENSQN